MRTIWNSLFECGFKKKIKYFKNTKNFFQLKKVLVS